MNRHRFWILLLDAALAVALFDGSHRLFRGSTGTPQLCDSTYSLLAAERILTTGSADLRANIPADPEIRGKMQGFVASGGLPYQFVHHTDPRQPGEPTAIYYGYPLGSTFLSMPLLKHYLNRGLSVIRGDGSPNLEVESLLQQRIACRVSAAVVVLFYVIARFFCSPLVAALLALGFGLGSPVWSTMSRSLWSHTWMVFWLGVVVVLLLIAKRREAKTWISSGLLGVGLGTALFAMAATRPHAVLSAGPILLYLALRDRRFLAATLLAGAAWTAGFISASEFAFGTPTPPSVYEPDPIDGHDVFSRFAWLLMSPSRGLLVYCPYLLVLGGMLIGHRRQIRDAGVLLPAGLSCAAYVAIFSMYNGWHAGSSYGPRYFSDLMPWLVLAGAMAVDAMCRAETSRWRKGLEAMLLALTFAWAIWVHGRGANSSAAWEWNYLSIAVGCEDAAKDWRHPQFLAGIDFVVRPDGSVVEIR